MALSRKKRRNIFRSSHMILLSAIVFINLLGITYAYWNDILDFHFSFSTGNLNPKFSKTASIDVIQGTGDLSVTFEDDYTMNIQGTVDSGYRALISYFIENGGTVPFRLVGFNPISGNGIVGIQSSADGQIYLGNSKLLIQAPQHLKIIKQEPLDDERKEPEKNNELQVGDALQAEDRLEENNELQLRSETQEEEAQQAVNPVETVPYSFEVELPFIQGE